MTTPKFLGQTNHNKSCFLDAQVLYDMVLLLSLTLTIENKKRTKEERWNREEKGKLLETKVKLKVGSDTGVAEEKGWLPKGSLWEAMLIKKSQE